MATGRVIEVEGRVGFPLDMLRYDVAVPAREEDSHRISRTLDSNEAHPSTRVRLYLPKGNEPTTGRWKSFGWHVHTYEIPSINSPELDR